MTFKFENKEWFDFLTHGQQDLVLACQELYEREKNGTGRVFHDYSFVVFPIAKAYEGFLKTYFFELGLISEQRYNSDHLRIGKSLNPDLPEKYRRDDWVVSRLNEMCVTIDSGRWKEKLLSEAFWQCWKKGRNLLFHFFPKHENFITLEEARMRISDIADVMEAALYCRKQQLNS